MHPKAKNNAEEFRSLFPVSILRVSPKPQQLFHRITLDGRIKTPCLNGGFATKQSFTELTAEQRANSWTQAAAKPAFLPSSLPLFPPVGSGQGPQTLSPLKPLVWWIPHFRCKFQGFCCVAADRRPAKKRKRGFSNWSGFFLPKSEPLGVNHHQTWPEVFPTRIRFHGEVFH